MPIQSATDLIAYAKRALGEPLVRVNVSDDQALDRLEDALQDYYDYHYSATERRIYKHLITDMDASNEYIIVPDEVIGISSVFIPNPSSNSLPVQEFNDVLWTDVIKNGGGITSWLSSEQHIDTVQNLFKKKAVWQFNRVTHHLYVQIDWDLMKGSYLVYEAIAAIDGNTYADLYNEPWLKRYYTALLKKQWGQNLSKFKNVELPGGMSIDGDQLIQEANEELDQLRSEMLDKFSLAGEIYLG